MRPIPVLLSAGLLTLAAVVGPSSPTGAQTEPKTTLRADMSADQEVPQPGPEGATGTATITVEAPERLCYTVTTQNLDEPVIAGHIHEGPKGVAGPVYIDLEWATNGNEGCVTTEKEKVDAVLADPPGYYVNLHTPSHGDGAIRGQLMRV